MTADRSSRHHGTSFNTPILDRLYPLPAPLPQFGDLRHLTLDALYAATEIVAGYCCAGRPQDVDTCLLCPNTGPAEALHDELYREIDRRPEHRRAVAALARRMRERR